MERKTGTELETGIKPETKPFVVAVELYSEELKCKELKTLSFSAIPTSCQNILDKVEELSELSIPCCLQTMWLHMNKIQNPNKCEPSSYLQSGDTVKVSYPIKCEGEKVRAVTTWLVSVTETLEMILELLDRKDSSTTAKDFIASLKHPDNTSEHKKYLFFLHNLFTPWSTKVQDMNCFYFDHLGGVSLLVKFSKQISMLKLLESEYARVVCTTHGSTCCRKLPWLECFIESFVHRSSTNVVQVGTVLRILRK